MKRLTMVIRDGTIEHVFYPVFPPDRATADVVAWLHDNPATDAANRPGVVIYTTAQCPYCKAAKELLNQRGVAFSEVDVDQDPKAASEMMARGGGRRTVPQIFMGSNHVGGSDELHALDKSGKLDALLAR